MKKLSSEVLLLLLLLPFLSFGQTTVGASEITTKIDRGEAVDYRNARIEGDLDLTQLSNRKLRNTEGPTSPTDQKFYVSTVTTPVSFANCTFTGKVLGYLSTDNQMNRSGNNNQWSRKHETFITDFTQSIRFTDCVFEEEVAFKFSEFGGGVTFAGCTFRREASFKHSQFEGKADFQRSVFEGDATFKHVHFPEPADFSQTAFRSEADFKHTNFSEGANFERARFTGFANFKHTHLASPSNLEEAEFKGSHDFKHTALNGQQFKGPGQGQK